MVHFGNYTCDLCPYRCNSAVQIKRHTFNYHEQVVACNLCDETISGGQYELEKHNSIKHAAGVDGRLTWQCTLCQAKLSGRTRTLLYSVKSRHVREVHNPDHDRYKCDYCDATFRLKFKFQHHMNQHTGVTPYECHQCNKAYTTQRGLYQHFKKSVAHREK